MDSFVKFRDETEKKLRELASTKLEIDSVASVENIKRVHVKLMPPNSCRNKYDRPMQFLTDLKKYVTSTDVSPACLGAVSQKLLTQKANRWFYTVEHKIQSFEDFEIAFKERY